MGQGTSARGLACPLSTPPADVQTVLWGDETSLPHTRWSFQSLRGMVRSSTASLSLLFPVSVTPLDLTCISFNPWSGLQLSEWQGSLHIMFCFIVLLHIFYEPAMTTTKLPLVWWLKFLNWIELNILVLMHMCYYNYYYYCCYNWNKKLVKHSQSAQEQWTMLYQSSQE